MRIHLETSKSNGIIPFNYQSYLTGALHKWIGPNNLHDESLSLYSFSWLKGGTTDSAGLSFKTGAHFFISAHDPELIKSIVKNIRKQPEIAFGLEVKNIVIIDDPKFHSSRNFFAASPIFIKRSINGNDKHFTYKDSESSELLTETLKNKLRKADLDDSEVSVHFDLEFSRPKTKVIYYHNIGNKVTICPVIIKGSPDQLLFAWNVGIGNSTGIGFGAIE